MTELLSILAVLVHGGTIVTVLFRDRRNPTATLAWLFAIVFLPLLGVLAYFVFGSPRARRIAKNYAEARETLGALLDKHRARDTTVTPRDTRTDAMLRLGRRLETVPASSPNRADMLVDAAATYRSMLEAIRAAADHIHVEFYIFQPDEVGRTLRDELVARAEAGIEVRVLTDAVGSIGLPDDFFAPLEAAGGHVGVFRPVKFDFLFAWRRHDRMDFRNHRKIVVVDGRIGFTGGINIGREYLGRAEEGRWRDTHVRIEGPAVLGLQCAFLEDWIVATGETLDDPRFYAPADPPADAKSTVEIVASGPDRTWSPISHVYVQACALARERIWITNPYFVPSPVVVHALAGAALRGVDVRILAPAAPIPRITGWAARSYYGEFLETGVRIFEYERGFIHAKTMVVDEWVGTIGSANLDTRSFHLNFELNAFVFGARFAKTMAEQFEVDLANATEHTPEREAATPFTHRIVQSLARLVGPLL